VTISNPDSLSSSETYGLILVRDAEKRTFLNELDVRNSGGIYFTQKRRAETLQAGFDFDNFKPRLTSDIFKYISLLSGSLLGGDYRFFFF
jgi:hypothetical protein